jgi:PAS domain S-box-containing protein
VEDAMEQVEAEETLRRSEERYRILFSSITDALFVHELKEDGSAGLFIEVNDVACDRLGYTREELLRMSPRDLDAPESCADLPSIIRSLAARNSATFEQVHVAKDGRRIPVEIHAKAFELQGLPSVISLVRDITDRKKADEKQILLVSTVEHAAEGIIIADKDAVIEYVNPAFERMSGYLKHEIVGRSAWPVIGHVSDADSGRTLAQALSERNMWRGRGGSRKKTGQVYETETIVSVVRNRLGDIISYVALKRDMSHEQQMEKQARQAQQMQAIGTLAGGISHDFNNILSAIIGNAEIMKLFHIAPDNPARPELEELLKAAYRAKELVRQILSFSRPDEPRNEPVELESLIRENLSFLRASLPSNIEIRIGFECRQSMIQADPNQIIQVLMNLCSNAAHAMAGKGGVLDIGLDEVDLVAQQTEGFIDSTPGRYLKLVIADTGHGMDRCVAERIFEPYFTTKKKGEGIGLGLSLVQGIVKKNGGAITVESEPGRGTIFSIFLPAMECLADKAREEDHQVLPRGNECILFVDDEESLVSMAKGILQPLGYEVVGETSGVEAIETFRMAPDRFDLVVTDIIMPKMTGTELMEELMLHRPEIPVIICSGFIKGAEEVEGMSERVRGVLDKPFSAFQLARIVRTVLDDPNQGG